MTPETFPDAVTKVYGELRGRIDGDLQAICYADDGSVATVEEGGILRRWNSENGEQLDYIMLSEVEACWSFSPDGRLLASGSNGISIWEVTNGTLLARLSQPSWMLTLAFSPDGKTIASGHDDHAVRLWSAETGKLLHSLECHSDEVCALAFSADGKRLASAGEDRLLVVWDVARGKLIKKLTGHTDRVDCLAWNAEGTRIASAGWDTSVRVWNPEDGELLAMLNGQGECVHCVLFVPGTNRLVCGDSDCVVRVWDYTNLKKIHELRRHQGAVKQLAIRRDGQQIATGGTDRAVQFWNIETGKAAVDDHGPLTQVHSIRVSNKNELAVLHTEGRLRLWNLSNGNYREAQTPGKVRLAVATSSGGAWASSWTDGTIDVGGDLLGTPKVAWKGHATAARLLEFSPDGTQLASSAATDGTVKLWNPADGEAVLVIPQATKNCTVEAIAYHPTQKILAAAGINWLGDRDADGVIALWNWETRKLEKLFEGGASRIAFRPDGKVLAAVSLYESIVIWDLESGVMIRELAGRDSSTNAIAFDPLNRYLASGSDDFGLRVWSCKDWSLLATYDLETCVKDVTFAPDGSALITGNGNSTCYRVELEGLSPNP
ncbi:MAG: WD40 repeat domain-containing protein [Planctomycetota bacterium]